MKKVGHPQLPLTWVSAKSTKAVDKLALLIEDFNRAVDQIRYKQFTLIKIDTGWQQEVVVIGTVTLLAKAAYVFVMTVINDYSVVVLIRNVFLPVWRDSNVGWSKEILVTMAFLTKGTH